MVRKKQKNALFFLQSINNLMVAKGYFFNDSLLSL